MSAYKSTPQSYQKAYEAQIAKIKATEKFKTDTKNLTKIDAYNILLGNKPRISETKNIFVDKTTGKEYATPQTTNLKKFLEERGYSVEDALTHPITDPSIFSPQKQTELRNKLREAEKKYTQAPEEKQTVDNTTKYQEITNTAPDPRIYEKIYTETHTENPQKNNLTSLLSNNILYIGLGFGAILLISLSMRSNIVRVQEKVMMQNA